MTVQQQRVPPPAPRSVDLDAPPTRLRDDAPPPERHQERRSTGGLTTDGILTVVGSILGGLALADVLYGLVIPFEGWFGFVITWYVMFLLVTLMVEAPRQQARDVVDRFVRTLVLSAGLLAVLALALVLTYTLVRGITAVKHVNFVTTDMGRTHSNDPLTQGGALHALVGSLWQVCLAVVFSVPLGIATAVFLVEVGGPVARPVRTIVDAMSALPSIIACASS